MPVGGGFCATQCAKEALAALLTQASVRAFVHFAVGSVLLLLLITVVRIFFNKALREARGDKSGAAIQPEQVEVATNTASLNADNEANARTSTGSDSVRDASRDLIGGLFVIIVWGMLYGVAKSLAGQFIDFALGVVAGFSVATLFVSARATVRVVRRWVDRRTVPTDVAQEDVNTVLNEEFAGALIRKGT